MPNKPNLVNQNESKDQPKQTGSEKKMEQSLIDVANLSFIYLEENYEIHENVLPHVAPEGLMNLDVANDIDGLHFYHSIDIDSMDVSSIPDTDEQVIEIPMTQDDLFPPIAKEGADIRDCNDEIRSLNDPDSDPDSNVKDPSARKRGKKEKVHGFDLKE